MRGNFHKALVGLFFAVLLVDAMVLVRGVSANVLMGHYDIGPMTWARSYWPFSTPAQNQRAIADTDSVFDTFAAPFSWLAARFRRRVDMEHSGFFGAIDLQYIHDPRYNQARGPIVVPGIRLYVETLADEPGEVDDTASDQ